MNVNKRFTILTDDSIPESVSVVDELVSDPFSLLLELHCLQDRFPNVSGSQWIYFDLSKIASHYCDRIQVVLWVERYLYPRCYKNAKGKRQYFRQYRHSPQFPQGVFED